MKVRPACPICVTRYCANCFYRDQAVNRLWLNKYLPGRECRRCGAVREAVTEKPVRHTSKTKHQEHVNEYARILLTKPPKLIDRGTERMETASELVNLITDHVFDIHHLRHWLSSGMYRSAYDEPGKPTYREIEVMNKITEDLAELDTIVRTWVAAHPEGDRG